MRQIELALDPPGVRQKSRAGVCEFHALVRANEQRVTEDPFQLGNADGERWLRNIAMSGCAGEVTLVDDGEEIAKQVTIQHKRAPGGKRFAL
ncbi:hypothetical protein SPHV1_220099 [Novosphingobium sp. KN65.2]|nr:hypothetical protein SPHV1_220099 [Novosphingobium sp. KN65.2]